MATTSAAANRPTRQYDDSGLTSIHTAAAERIMATAVAGFIGTHPGTIDLKEGLFAVATRQGRQTDKARRRTTE